MLRIVASRPSMYVYADPKLFKMGNIGCIPKKFASRIYVWSFPLGQCLLSFTRVKSLKIEKHPFEIAFRNRSFHPDAQLCQRLTRPEPSILVLVAPPISRFCLAYVSNNSVAVDVAIQWRQKVFCGFWVYPHRACLCLQRFYGQLWHIISVRSVHVQNYLLDIGN